MHFINPADVWLKKRNPLSRKGDNGRVLAVVGSIDYAGAAYLSGLAAFRAGVDLVVVAAPEKVAWAINCLSPDIITKKFKGDCFSQENAKAIVEVSKNFDVTLIGNGLGKNEKTLKFAASVCRQIKGFKVIDADAISAIRIQDVKNSIITPHMGELAVLLKNSNCKNELSQMQQNIGNNVLVAKGYNSAINMKKHLDAIISKSKVVFNKSGNAGMTVGGTGDVLAGLAAGILAQEKDLFRSACVAAYANGKAGDALKRKYGVGFMASDLLEVIPKLLRDLQD